MYFHPYQSVYPLEVRLLPPSTFIICPVIVRALKYPVRNNNLTYFSLVKYMIALATS